MGKSTRKQIRARKVPTAVTANTAQASTFDERLRYPIKEASALLKQSVAKTYLDIAAGTLQTIKDGGRRYVPGSEILRKCAAPSQ